MQRAQRKNLRIDNSVNPYEWLKDILTVIPDHKANRLEELLPHRWRQNKANTQTTE